MENRATRDNPACFKYLAGVIKVQLKDLSYVYQNHALGLFSLDSQETGSDVYIQYTGKAKIEK